MNTSPLDFVLLIPCYNNSTGLITSLKSVEYPKEKCEVLIVDDGSIIPISMEELQTQLPFLNIHVIRIDKNRGIVNALNTGLTAIQAKDNVRFIARLDAGDTCDPERFHKQVNFLNKHPDIALLASWARFENTDKNEGYDYVTKTKHEEILKEMHYKCSFIHPSVMFKTEILQTIGLYPTNYPHAEDYAFFWKILKVYKSSVLPEMLIEITFSSTSISRMNYKKQLKSRMLIVNEFGCYAIHKFCGSIILYLKGLLPLNLIQKLKQVLS